MRMALKVAAVCPQVRHYRRHSSACFAFHHAPNNDSRVTERAAANNQLRMKLNSLARTLNLPPTKSK